jgi:hypothetical protein
VNILIINFFQLFYGKLLKGSKYRTKQKCLQKLAEVSGLASNGLAKKKSKNLEE